MAKLAIKLPIFGDKYDGQRFRLFIELLESALSKITVDITRPYTKITANYSITPYDSFLIADSSTQNITVTLPKLNQTLYNERFAIIVKKMSANNSVFVAATVGDTIDGQAVVTLTANNSTIQVRATEFGWLIV